MRCSSRWSNRSPIVARQPSSGDFSHDYDIDLPGSDVSQQSLQGWPLGRAAGISAVLVARPDEGPSRMGLTVDIGLRGLMLGVQPIAPELQCPRWSGYPPKVSVKADIPVRQPSANCGLMQCSKNPIIR
jgi:hypothetical protein